MKLADVRQFLIPSEVIEDTTGFLRQAGSDGVEGCALWAGRLTSRDTFVCTRVLVPRQRATSVSVYVDEQALREISNELAAEGEVLGVQVHSHPGEAFHTTTDEDENILTKIGALSVVVPDFARNPIAPETCAVFRLEADGTWAGPLSGRAARRLLRFGEPA